MEYIFLLIVVGILLFTIFRILRKRSLPSNRYTPFDDITQQNIKVTVKNKEEYNEEELNILRFNYSALIL